jgi:hypothetical protein
MPYGAIKVDNITFTNASADQATTVSGIYRAITSGVTVTGTISGVTIQGATVSGTTVTGTTANFVSGVFTTQLSGATVTGTTANFTSGNFTALSGASTTVTSGIFAVGSAAAPSISFTSDPNTGIYSPGADQVAISTNGTGRLFVDASGRVGVGVGSPVTALQVVGTATFGNGVGGRLQATTDANLGYIDSLNNTSTEWQPLLQRGTEVQFHTNTAGVTPVEKVRITSAGLVGIGTSAPSSVLHCVGGKDATNFTIGAPLSTVGGGALSNYSQVTFENTSGANANAAIRAYGNIWNSAGSALSLMTSSGGSPVDRLHISSSGSVGIGTTSAGNLLHVLSASAAEFIRIEGSSTRLYLGYQSTNNEIYSQTNTGAAANLLFYTGAAERARIDSSGRVGIGISSIGANHALEVSGNQKYLAITTNTGAGGGVNPSGGGGCFLGWNRSNGDGESIIAYGTGAGAAPRLEFASWDGTTYTERMRITSGGLINIGTATAPSAIPGHDIRWQGSARCNLRNVDATASNCYGILIDYPNAAPNDGTHEFLYCQDNAAGSTQRATIRANGGIANFQANNVNLSDINTKKDIAPAADTWDCLKEWEIVNYHYKEQPDDADLNLGVIAQQVAKSCPEVITVFQQAKEATEDKPAQEERLGVKEQQMYWMAIKALQEAQARIEALETDVAQLKGE